MTLNRLLFPCLLTGTVLLGCSNEYESRVRSFNCGPEPDTTIAVLSGRIVERKVLAEDKDTLVPLSGAVVSLEKGRRTITTDTAGAFTLYLDLMQTHPFTVTKPGYQPLNVEGFFAEKQTLAEINVVLAQGNTERTGRVTVCKIAY